MLWSLPSRGVWVEKPIAVLMDCSKVTAITSLYGVDNQSKKEISIHDKNRANSYLQTYGSSASVEEAVRSTVESVLQDTDSVNPQYSARIYEHTDDDILADLGPSKLTTQAERESYFRQFGSLPHAGVRELNPLSLAFFFPLWYI